MCKRFYSENKRILLNSWLHPMLCTIAFKSTSPPPHKTRFKYLCFSLGIKFSGWLVFLISGYVCYFHYSWQACFLFIRRRIWLCTVQASYLGTEDTLLWWLWNWLLDIWTDFFSYLFSVNIIHLKTMGSSMFRSAVCLQLLLVLSSQSE